LHNNRLNNFDKIKELSNFSFRFETGKPLSETVQVRGDSDAEELKGTF